MNRCKVLLFIFSVFLCLEPAIAFSEDLSIESCHEKFMSIRAKSNLSLIEKKNLWDKNKSQCSSNGTYQLYLIDFYVFMSEFDKAKSMIESILEKEKEYDKSITKIALSYSIALDIENPELRKHVKQKIIKVIKEYHDLYQGYSLMGFLSMKEKNFEDAKDWYLKAIKETDVPEKLARVYSGLSSALFYLKKPEKEVLESFEKAWSLDPGQTLLNGIACRGAVFTLLSQNKIEDAKYIVNMQEKHIESVENDSDLIESKKAIAQYERKLKEVAGE